MAATNGRFVVRFTVPSIPSSSSIWQRGSQKKCFLRFPEVWLCQLLVSAVPSNNHYVKTYTQRPSMNNDKTPATLPSKLHVLFSPYSRLADSMSLFRRHDAHSILLLLQKERLVARLRRRYNKPVDFAQGDWIFQNLLGLLIVAEGVYLWYEC